MNTKHCNLALGVILASLVAASILSSCNNEYGIYKTILEEKPGPTIGPNYRTSVAEVVSFDGSLWTRAATIMKKTGSEARSSVQGGGLPTSYTSTGLAATTTTLYVALYGDGLYSLGTGGGSWSKAVADTTIEALFAAHNILFVVNHDEKGTTVDTSDDVWTLFTYGGSGSTLNPVSITLAAGTPVLSVRWDGSAYWVLTPGGLYSSASETTAFAPSAVTTWNAAAKLASMATGIGGTGTANLYVGAEDGKIYVRRAGTWEAAITASSASYAVTALAELPAGASINRLLAGFGGKTSGAAGYVEIDLSVSPPAVNSGGGSAALVSGATSYETNLADKPVNGFYLVNYSNNTSDATLYASVAGGVSGASGLYYSPYTGSTGSWNSWTSE